MLGWVGLGLGRVGFQLFFGLVRLSWVWVLAGFGFGLGLGWVWIGLGANMAACAVKIYCCCSQCSIQAFKAADEVADSVWFCSRPSL